jgi:small subunit ribosomal protein S1
MSEINPLNPEVANEEAVSSSLPQESEASVTVGEEAPLETAISFEDELAAYERENVRRPVSDDGARSNQINGVVVSITTDAVLVDIGYKTEGTLPLSVFGEKPPAIGDKLLVTSKGRNDEGYYDLSLQRVAQPSKSWSGQRSSAASSS